MLPNLIIALVMNYMTLKEIVILSQESHNLIN